MTDNECKLCALLHIARNREAKALILQSYIQQYGPISEPLKAMLDLEDEEE